MEVILEIIDWILRITGLVSIIIISLTIIFYKKEKRKNKKRKRCKPKKDTNWYLIILNMKFL